MTATATTIFVGEKLSLIGWAGIVALAAGVFLLSARGGRDLVKIDRRAVGFALLTALTICAYSVVDGIGARLAGNPNAYVALAVRRHRAGAGALRALPRRPRRHPGDAAILAARLAGGALQTLSYGIALWAMTLAPIAIVATLRETSVLFGAASPSSCSRSRCARRASAPRC